MAGCPGRRDGAKCGRPLRTCSKCSTVGCANSGCSNCKFRGGKCSVCGNVIPFSFFSRLASLFVRRDA